MKVNDISWEVERDTFLVFGETCFPLPAYFFLETDDCSGTKRTFLLDPFF